MAKTESPSTPKADRAKKGESPVIAINLSEFQQLLEKIRTAAKEDDREPSKYLRRRLVELARQGQLIRNTGKENK